jgi:hypothetical protein
MKRKLTIAASILALAGFLFVFIAPEIPTPNVVVKSPQVQVAHAALLAGPVARGVASTRFTLSPAHPKPLPSTESLIDLTCVRLC